VASRWELDTEDAGGAGMAEDRSAVLWGMVAAQAAAAGHRVSVADVCAVAVRSVLVSGGWVAAAGQQGPDFVICVTDPVSEQLAELQLMLGEGPCHDVLASAGPVLAVDLGDERSARRWPGFAGQARLLGAAAVFAFPLTIGAIRAGVMGMYRSSAGPLPWERFGDALTLADLATMLLLDGLGHNGDGNGGGGASGPVLDGQSPDLALHRAEIDQATGMLTVQLGVPVAEAFARLRAYAYAQDRRLADVARDIVARRLRLQGDPAWDGGP
jgi:ANTAR domain